MSYEHVFITTACCHCLVSRLDEENLVHLLFAWRLFDRLQNKTYLFAHRSVADKTQMIDALEYERAYVEENLSKGLEIPLYTRLTSLKTQQYRADQPLPMSRSTTATSFPLITKPSKFMRVYPTSVCT
jgi:hypothetical protein